VVDSAEDIKETDHVFQVVDQSTLRKTDKEKVPAVSDNNGLNIKIGTDVANDIISGKNTRSATHELGNTGGLHDTNINDTGVPIKRNNLMTQSIFLQNKSINQNAAIILNPYQINSIYENRKNVNNFTPLRTKPTTFYIDSSGKLRTNPVRYLSR
jgi:hypothetical protein